MLWRGEAEMSYIPAKPCQNNRKKNLYAINIIINDILRKYNVKVNQWMIDNLANR